MDGGTTSRSGKGEDASIEKKHACGRFKRLSLTPDNHHVPHLRTPPHQQNALILVLHCAHESLWMPTTMTHLPHAGGMKSDGYICSTRRRNDDAWLGEEMGSDDGEILDEEGFAEL